MLVILAILVLTIAALACSMPPLVSETGNTSPTINPSPTKATQQPVDELTPSTSTVTVTPTPTYTATPDLQPSFPIRAAFYYPWFPEAWDIEETFPYSKYEPDLGYYDSSERSIIESHVESMEYGNIAVGIASWWGQDTPTDQRIGTILDVSGDRALRWLLYYEAEGFGNPSVEQIEADLTYIHERYGQEPNYLRFTGDFVIFVSGDVSDNCEMPARWKAANTVGAYVVLQVFPGYDVCDDQPEGWHQYASALPVDRQGTYSYTISPGFNKVGESPRLTRDLARWNNNIKSMIVSGADFQLITTFNEWGEGTAVESAKEWQSSSGYGWYLDALHYDGDVVERDPILVGAGDIAKCDRTGDEATADLLDGVFASHVEGLVFTTGDNVYPNGLPTEFANCYDPNWGRHKRRTRPSPGNHDYHTSEASGYFDYFGETAGEPGKGYYSYDLGEWHIIVINSNCSKIEGCDEGSPQEQWLRSDLETHSEVCTLAYWHHPLFSSGQHGNSPIMKPIWETLYEYGVDVVLNGHDHDYERFAPQDPDGEADSERGIRQFVVGSGGRSHYAFPEDPLPNSEVRNDDTYGILKLTLHSSGYDWEFIPVEGKTFRDVGSDVCH
jgi:hypothetical protein